MAFYYPIPEKITKSKIVYDCDKCGLYKWKHAKHPVMEPYIGSDYKGIVVVANKPSVEDDLKGTPLINDKAKAVRSAFFKNRINFVKDVAITYAACCRSEKGKVTDVQYKCCTNILSTRLIELKPKLIITLGDQAFKSVMNLKIKYGATKIRNRIVPNYEYNCLVFPIFDPNVVNSYHYRHAMERDIERISELWHKRYRKRTEVNEVLKNRKILDGITIHEVKPNEVEATFAEIHQLDEVAFDYETTNANPYDSFFEITHIGFAKPSYAWIFHESLWENDIEMWDTVCSHMRIILTNPNLLKIIQNAKFEDQASRYVFGIKELVNSFCTMLATHVVDERRGCTSLDFQNLMRFGIPPYSETIKPFIVPKSKDHKVNTIRQAPHDDMITYAGLDVITTYHNYLVLNNDLLVNAYPQAKANYEFLHKGHWVFANMSQRGIPIGEKEYSDLEDKLNENIDATIDEIFALEEFQEFNETCRKREIKGIDKNPDKELKLILNSYNRKDDDDDQDKRITKSHPRKTLRINRKVSFE